MNFYLGKQSLSHLIGVHPEVAFCCTEAIKITPIDFAIVDGVRNYSEQERMVATGASETLDSYHLYGLAVDVVAWINRKLRWEIEPNKKIMAAMKEVSNAHGLGIDCLYELYGFDIYHHQKTNFKEKYDIRKLKFPIM